MTDNIVNILVVEDDEIDRMALKRGFAAHKIANPIIFARDGLEALELLRGDGTPPMPCPYIILLDLNMPRMNGLEFLKALRADEDLHRSVVFVLTTSKAEEDRVRAYDHNVAGYMVKSDVGKSFINCLSMLDHYWKVVLLP